MERIALEDYVRRVMRDKNLSALDVERISGRRISDSYINKIVAGEAKSLTIDKVQALATGLGIGEEEIFRVVRGLPIDGETFDPQLARIVELWSTYTDEVKTQFARIAEVLNIEFPTPVECVGLDITLKDEAMAKNKKPRQVKQKKPHNESEFYATLTTLSSLVRSRPGQPQRV